MLRGIVIFFIIVLLALYFDVPSRIIDASQFTSRRSDAVTSEPLGLDELQGEDHLRRTGEAARSTNDSHDTPLKSEQQTPTDLARALDIDARPTFEAGVQGDESHRQDQQGQAVTLPSKLVDKDRDMAARIEMLQKRLEGERARSVSLDHDLVGLREELAQSIRDRAVEKGVHPAAEVIAADIEAKLREERKRTTDLANTLAQSERDAAAQVETLQRRLEGERARSASLGHDLVGLREELTRPVRENIVKDDAHHVAEVSAAETEAKLREERTWTAESADKLAKPERDAAARIEAPRQEAVLGRAAPERSEASAEASGPKAPPVPPLAEALGVSNSLPPVPAATAASTDISLPDGMPARVVLRYAHQSEVARTRAMKFSSILRAQGFELADPVDIAGDKATNSVTFFYAEDQGSAKRIAAVVSLSAIVQSRLRTDGPLPRPGTIEVSIAG